MGSSELEEDEAVKLILDILESGGPLTTREVQEVVEENRARCPDSTAVFLNKLRRRGIIEGKMSKDKGGWVWWIER